MRGLMMDRPLLIPALLDHGATGHHDQEIVTRTVEGPLHRYTYAEARRRSKTLANALIALGVQEGDRVGTIAWNTHRHFELYFGISGVGAVCHTMNPRLHPSQLAYIINHAEDRVLFVDTTFLPLVEALAGQLPSVEAVVVLTDRDHLPLTKADVMVYEDLLADHDDDFTWPALDERTASSLCYTSGTTGHPKGVLYSHRSTVLHSFALALPGGLRLSETESVLPVVPMFHANAWGIPYAAVMTGVKLVLPGPRLDGESLTQLLCDEEVTMTAGVPTVWMGLLAHWDQSGSRVPSLERVVVGGSAPPRSMMERFQEQYGVELVHAWGMTETSPLGSVNQLKPAMRSASTDERYRIQCKQGRPPFGVEMQIVDEGGVALRHDGKTCGELRVRGPWICDGYFKSGPSPAHTDDGWFATGDVVTIDTDGYMHITDRAKDLIKSGGEWISSIDLENVAMAHPDVAQAAVIGVAHDKWTERPVLVVVPKPDSNPTKASILEFLTGRVAKWWLPDEVIFEAELPIGGTGKVQKNKLRERYAKVLMAGS